jgi:hypothetical protein
MNDEPPESIVSLAKRRRLRRTLEFLAATMGTGLGDSSPTPSHRFDDLKQLAGLPIDIAVVRTIAPKQRRELLSHVRFRRQTCILARLRDPVEGIAELTIDVALYDVGVAILYDLSIYTDGRKWWLIGRPHDVLFRLTEEGPIPTMTEPWARSGTSAAEAGRRRWSGISEAERLFADYIWSA